MKITKQDIENSNRSILLGFIEERSNQYEQLKQYTSKTEQYLRDNQGKGDKIRAYTENNRVSSGKYGTMGNGEAM